MAQFLQRLIERIGLPLRNRHLDPQVVARVAEVTGVAEPHVLTWGTGRHDGRPATAVAVEEGLAVVGEDGGAEAVAWHEVVRGGWRETTSTLWWSFLDEQTDEVQLDRPGDIPEVFNDRVTMSIVVREPIQTDRGTVVIAGRRPLGRLGNDQILWTAIADGGADLTDPATEHRVIERTAELKKEWH